MDSSSKNLEYKSAKYLRLAVVIIFAWCFLNAALHPEIWHFIDNVDLILHEAGHWIFIFLGEFMSVLGGSLTQVAIPLVFAIYFYIKKDIYSTSILSMWVGYNSVNVSVYMADSIKMVLPLLGGESSIHDWNYIFVALHILNESLTIASVTRIVGIFVIIAGAVFAVRSCLLEEKV